ncbi:hypothetical protein [Streptomyces uncialis]|uniref:acyl-CoA thioesterase n=1 Tax=Streptomyces uncialis TaxID=1048205 RepID=UPI003F4D2154
MNPLGGAMTFGHPSGGPPRTSSWRRRPHSRSNPLRPLRGGPSKVCPTSLDHAIWFHRPFPADEWLLFAQRSPSSVDGRALTFADVWSQDGRLLAHVVQEGVLRPLREPPP